MKIEIMKIKSFKKGRKNIFSTIFDLITYGGVGIFALICFLPFLYIFTYSITPYADYLRDPMNFFPRNIDFEAYIAVFKFRLILSGYKNTIFITVVSTFMHLVVLIMIAYPLSKPGLKGRKFIFLLILMTRYFDGGIIPSFYLARQLGLLNSLWALIIPPLLSAYPVILMQSFIREIPDSLEEAALIEGAGEITVLFKIILPLSIPAVVTLGLFQAVYSWNTFFNAIIYITDRNLWPLQLVLRELIIEGQIDEVSREFEKVVPFNMKMAIIMSATLPILCVYPFIQKYFMKGLLLGAVKG